LNDSGSAFIETAQRDEPFRRRAPENRIDEYLDLFAVGFECRNAGNARTAIGTADGLGIGGWRARAATARAIEGNNAYLAHAALSVLKALGNRSGSSTLAKPTKLPLRKPVTVTVIMAPPS
jgi:hypothetical protein